MKQLPPELYFALQSSLVMTNIIDLLPDTDICMLLKETLLKQNSALISIADETKLDHMMLSEWILELEKVKWQIEELENIY